MAKNEEQKLMRNSMTVFQRSVQWKNGIEQSKLSLNVLSHNFIEIKIE